MFLKISQNSQGNTCAKVSFLMKLQVEAYSFIKKETLTQVFSYEFCEISKSNFFTEHLWATASVQFIKKCIFCWSLNHKRWHTYFMITSISYLLFPHNIRHCYLIFLRTNIFFLIPTLIHIISAAFWRGIISDLLLKSFIKLHLYWISSSSNMKVGGGSYCPPSINHLQRVQL